MAGLEVRNFDSPDETRPFVDRGKAQLVSLSESTVLKGTFEPGWRWTEHLKSIAGTDSCQSPHFFYVLSGRMHIAMDDGTEGDCGPGDVVRAEPGHDAWVVGDEPCVAIDFGAMASYAEPTR